MKLFEAFSGYGSQALALKKYGIEFESVGIAEIDKYAIQAHEALHGKVKNYGDVSKLSVDELPNMDLFTYSFPCQDISNAGLQRGLEKGSGTRSSLLWECERIIEGKRPKFLMMENVKNLVGKKNKPQFEVWLKTLEDLGYNNYWKVINAKWCGVPQNRERVFCVSILKEFDNGQFYFKDDFDNGIRLKDILESDVDEKYYINKQWHITTEAEQKHDTNEIAQVDGINYKATRSIGDINKLCRCIDTMGGGQREPKILVKKATKKGYKEAYECDSINLEHPNSKTRRGRVGDQVAQTLTTSCNQAVVEPNIIKLGKENGNHYGGGLYSTNGISPTLVSSGAGGGTNNIPKVESNIRIRKLTPKECFRLMGLSDEEIDKIQATGISNSQQYKLAGNSIVVDCMKFLKNL